MSVKHPTERELLQHAFEANRSAMHHRALRGEYSYERILGADLVDRCLAAFERSSGTVRVLDVGCGDGWALHQLKRHLAKLQLDRHFEFVGLGMNRYDEMYLDVDHFLHAGLNQLIYDGPKFDLVFSVFTFHYVWHKVEALEKIHNHLMAPGAEALLHFPAYLVGIDEEEALDEDTRNEAFGKIVASFAMHERNPDMSFRVVPYTSDDDDGTPLDSFGVLSMTKSERWLDCGLLYDGCELVSHRSGNVYVASRYTRRRTLFGRTGFVKQTLTRRVTTSTEHVSDYPYDIKLDLCIHSLASPRIIINYPGASRDVDGMRGRFKAIAAELQDKQLAAMVRVNNPFIRNFDYPSLLRDNLRFVIDYVLEHAEQICGRCDPALYLMGHSAGASAIGAVVGEYPQVAKVLLLSPSLDAGKDEIRAGLADYAGLLYVVVGMEDHVVLPAQSRYFMHVADRAEPKKFVALWHCDHDFHGATNDDLLRRAPLWAFFDDPDFPDDGPASEPHELIYR